MPTHTSLVKLFALLLITAATACGAAPPPVALPASTPENVSAGEKEFQRACASCHGAAAEGGKTAPALADEVGHHDDAFLIDVMLKGHEAMPPADVTQPQAELVMVWLRSRFKK